MGFFGLENLKAALEKLGRVWNQEAFLALLQSKLTLHKARIAAALVAERKAIGAAVADALTEYPEEAPGPAVAAPAPDAEPEDAPEKPKRARKGK